MENFDIAFINLKYKCKFLRFFLKQKMHTFLLFPVITSHIWQSFDKWSHTTFLKHFCFASTLLIYIAMYNLQLVRCQDIISIHIVKDFKQVKGILLIFLCHSLELFVQNSLVLE